MSVADAPLDDTVVEDAVVEDTAPQSDSDIPWKRLHHRMIWVDIAQTLLSLTPIGIAHLVVGLQGGVWNNWPVVLIAVLGITGAIADFLRWVFTRYRVTPAYVERRTGIFVRRYRSVRRDRIRSVDIDARLRHRLSGLRVVSIGAGQQMAAAESAFKLDAVLKADAEELRYLLLKKAQSASAGAAMPSNTVARDDARGTDDAGAGGATGQDGGVFARLRPHWVVFNMFSSWAYIMALGLLWGLFWLLSMFGVDAGGWVSGLLDWEALGLGWTIVISLVVVGAFGAIGMGFNFFTSHWGFELSRIPGEHGTLLRTRQGLFRVREVDRDDNRMRGVHISEPVLWRWMGMADTEVITTGLSVWSMSQPSAILPRGPIGVARPVAARVLDADPSPLDAPLVGHPARALTRRLWWATAFTGIVTAVLWLFVHNGVLGAGVLWAGAAVWAVALLGAVVAYRALGHTIAGDYLVTRSGLMSRRTAVLARSSVSTITLRESVFQRRLGLKTVKAMTAAGWGQYVAPDVSADEALAFADQAAPGLLEPFLER